MPEGPEVRREADRIAKVVVGRPLESVYFGQPHMQRFADYLIDSEVTSVGTHGKAMLTHFANGYSVYSHNQLYGKWYVARRDRPPVTNRQLRFALHTATHSALLYSASSIELWETSELSLHPFLAKLGPDVLAEGLPWRQVMSRLEAMEYRKRRLASLYLDQGFLAGVGNYMRSEILFAARLSPMVRPQDLSRAELGRLARNSLQVSQRAYATAGITTAAALVKKLQRRGLKRREFRFAVFDRDDQPCFYCDTPIIKTIASRRLYYCPSCQATDTPTGGLANAAE